MRQQLITTIILIIVLVLTLLAKLSYFPHPSGQATYFFLSVFWICGFLIVFLVLNMLWHLFNGPKAPKEKDDVPTWPNRRKSFRIIYPSYIRPTLVVETTDKQPRRNLEFQIVDLSQEGTCFLDDGSLGPIKRFSGHIRFVHGASIRVAGKAIYSKENQISVKFNRAIEWSALLDEQRRILAQMKPAQ